MPFNSREFEFADIQVSLLGKKISGLRGLTYKKSQDKELIYGAGNTPKSIQRGNKKYAGTLTLLQSEVDELNAVSRAAGYEDITDVPGSALIITCVYSQDAQLKTDTCMNCEFTDFEYGMKQGDKFKEIALPFVFLTLKQA